MNAPYNTPSALGREPLTAIFMVLLAPMLIEVLVFGLANLVEPGLIRIEGEALTRDHVRTIQLLACIVAVLYFALLSGWSQRIGAGAFAGTMRAPAYWLVIGVVVGPMCLILPTMIANIAMAGQEGWAYADDYDPSWDAKANWSLTTIFFVALLAPIVEEVAFRGVAMGAMLARGINPYASATIASFVFMTTHFQYSPAALAVVFVAGLGFSALRLLSGSMLVPIVAHISANGLVLWLQALADVPAT